METIPKFYTDSNHYVYEKRSCENCTNFIECERKVKRDNRVRWLDCGRMGCVKYHSENTELMQEIKNRKGKIKCKID